MKWPPLLVGAAAKIYTENVGASLIGYVERADGTCQVTTEKLHKSVSSVTYQLEALSHPRYAADLRRCKKTLTVGKQVTV